LSVRREREGRTVTSLSKRGRGKNKKNCCVGGAGKEKGKKGEEGRKGEILTLIMLG